MTKDLKSLLEKLTRENTTLRNALEKIAFGPRFEARMTARRVLIKVDRLRAKSIRDRPIS